MTSKGITIPEDVIVNILKSLPKERLAEIFWRSLVEIDISPLTDEEREDIKKAKLEFEKGETVSWEDIK